MELKIKCQCGVKYALDVTPQTVANPIQFVCQYCCVDSSAAVNEIIRQQFKASVLPPTERLPTLPAAAAPIVAATSDVSARGDARPPAAVLSRPPPASTKTQGHAHPQPAGPTAPATPPEAP